MLRPGRLVRRLWSRSAPALASLAVLMATTVAVVSLTGEHAVDINGRPTRGEWFVLAMIVLVLSVLASAVPARSATRLTIREVLAYE